MNKPIATDKAVRAGRIRVLLVDDSPLALEIISRMLALDPEIEVVGRAGDGQQALDLIDRVKPHVVCTDLHMPNMNGLELTRQIMVRHPMPILVLSVSVQPEQNANVMEMLSAGALDIMAKPRGGIEESFTAKARELIKKVRILSGVVVIRRNPRAVELLASEARIAPISDLSNGFGSVVMPKIVGIGSSTGGPQALEYLLGHLPQAFPLPIICAQHMAEGFMSGLVGWLAERCRLPVQTAIDGQLPKNGTVYFPPDGHHIEISREGLLRCTAPDRNLVHQPSVDLMMKSLVNVYGGATVGVLLTGMGRDGVGGMLEIMHAGGMTIAQDEASCAIFGMPKQAIAAGAVRSILPLDQIASTLCQFAATPQQSVYGS